MSSIKNYAVLRINGRQYKVSEGQEFEVDKQVDPKNVEAEALLIADGDKVQVGKPVVKDAKVSLKVVTELGKGEKVDVYHFKSKSRYKKHTGFRPQYTTLLVEKIS